MIAYLEFVFARIFLKIVQALPFNILMGLARCVGRLGWWLDPIHRRMVQKNLQVAFGGDDKNGPLLLAKESVVRVAENAFAAAWMADRSDNEIHDLVELAGIKECLLPAMARKRGVVHVMFHLGNWECQARIVSRIPEARFSTIYQPLKNSHFDAMIARWRSQSGVRLINRHHGFAEAVRHLRRGEAVGMFVDQHAGDHGMWVPFFGKLASTTPLPAILARRTNAAIIPIFCLNVPSNPVVTSSKQPATIHVTHSARWRVEFGAPIHSEGRTDGEIMMDIHTRLEEVIRQDPANWFWLHNRWKTPSPNFLVKKYRRGVYVPHGVKLKPFRILVRTSNWLGDTVLSIPALRAIKEGRPDAHVTLLTPPKLADLWRRQNVDAVITSVNEAHQMNFDAAILLPNSFRSALEVCRLGIPTRVGYAGHWRRGLLTAICPESQRGDLHEHDAKDFYGLAHWLGGKIRSEIPTWEVPAPSPTQNSKSKTRSSYIVLHAGAAHGSAKRWLPERFVELVKLFPDTCWRLIGSAEEHDRNSQLAALMGKHVEDWTDRTRLTELAEMMAGARAVVCNDSGPMHLAAAVGAPVVAIFGSTEPTHTGPLTRPGQRIRVVRRVVECSPCYLKECPIDLRCMKAVSVDDVSKALREVLASANV